jgi:hypothetical protein
VTSVSLPNSPVVGTLALEHDAPSARSATTRARP